MAYTTYIKKNSKRELNSQTLSSLRKQKLDKPDTIQFYEYEPAVVLDVIRDETHPIFKSGNTPKIVKTEWPTNYANPDKPDYSYIGRIKARPVFSSENAPTDELIWFIPIDHSIKEYPLVNEMVIIVKYLDSWYYQRRINSRNFINNSADYRWETRYGGMGPLTKNKTHSLKRAKVKSDLGSDINMQNSYLGNYFKANDLIRPLKHYEGDLIIESRFGSSVRFGCYEDDPEFDVGTLVGHGERYDENRGNPSILIRNRQRPLQRRNNTTQDANDEEIFQHTIQEDINADGSSIHITSGKTLSKFQHSLVGPPPPNTQEKKKKIKKNFEGLSGISKSSVGTGSIKSSSEPTVDMTRSQNPTDSSGNKNYDTTVYQPQKETAKYASKKDLGGAMTASMSAAMGPSNGKAAGKRFENMPQSTAKKVIETPDNSTDSSFFSNIGKGNFNLNSTFEKGLVSATKSGMSAGKNALLKTPQGQAISAANSLGMMIPGAEEMGMTPDDSPMFKIFKLASFGIQSICSGLKNKPQNSKTENTLGWMLSIGINLELLDLLASIFAKLRNLKFNFGAFAGFDLDNILNDLCGWINQIEYGSSLTDTLKGEATKLMDDKQLTLFAGNKFKNEGTYDAYARGNQDFDYQYKSILSDLGSLGGAASNFGQTNISLQKGNNQVASMSFDPISGLYRDTPNEIESQPEVSSTPTNTGTITFDTQDSNIQFENTTTSSASTAFQPTGPAPTDLNNQTPQNENTTPTQGSALPQGNQSQIQDSQNKPNESVNNFHNGEEITRESLKGTHLENADLDAVSLLHPDDLNVLKDTKSVNNEIEKAKKVKENNFNKNMDKVEEEVEKEAGNGNVMFGNPISRLDGNQIIINSERLILSAKTKELILYGKGKFGLSTDNEFTINAVQRLVTVTATHTSMVSPTIHLGEYLTFRHPVLKGDVTVSWLSGLCGWLSGHVHNDPYITTSKPAQQGQLAGLRARLPTLLSTRVFIAG